MDLGFVQAGFHIVSAIDNWKPAVETYKANAKLFGGSDILNKSLDLADRELAIDDLPWSEVIVGGPPCQGFSFAGRQFLDDPRNKLYLNFVQIVKRKQPRMFLMENVRGMQAMALDEVKAAFTSAGYRINVSIANAVDFGVAQRRERLIIVGVRNDITVDYDISSAKACKVKKSDKSILDAIGNLPPPVKQDPEGSLDITPIINAHIYKSLPLSVQAFMRHVPNGGCFRDAPRDTLPERLQRILDNPAKYRSPRLFPKPDPYLPSQTIPADTNPSLGGVLAPDLRYTDQGASPIESEKYTKKDVYTSPVPARRVTPREAARLQSFPDNFIFRGSISTQHRLVGNAVPVRLAEAYARSLLEFLQGLDSKRMSLKRSI
jgi:DNA (cytosine-5)-methyltransferase 1